MSEENDLLREAVARGAGVVLSLPSLGMLRHHKSRFLGQQGDDILLESIAGESALIEELITTTKPAGVSFKNGATKVMFASPVIERIVEYRINSTTIVQALRLSWPTAIKAIQRRSNYRVRVGGEAELSARVWRIAPKAILRDRPLSTAEIPAQLLDLSAGGMGVMLTGAREEPLRIDHADRLRVEISQGDRKLLLEASLKHPLVVPRNTTTLRAGLAFIALENDLVGRQNLAILTKIVGVLQRAEVRRARLGLMSV